MYPRFNCSSQCAGLHASAMPLLCVQEGHNDTVTGVSLSPDGNFLLSNAADNTLRMFVTVSFIANAHLTFIPSHMFPTHVYCC